MIRRSKPTAFRLAALPAAVAFAMVPGQSEAQDAPPDPPPTSGEPVTLDRIEVTGSRIKRTDLETSQPIFSLNREEIQAQGLTSVGDVIQNLTANGSALNTQVNNGGNGETQVTLRNLGSNRTLVLVNGRRWVGGTGLGGAVDLNTIPTAAVERIEVLKDGASTIYGSDAIAGVVNVILRKDFDGAEANAFIGSFDKGDGYKQSYDFTIGSVGERWSAMIGIGYVKEEAVLAGDREISAVPVFGSLPGTGFSASSPNGNFSIFDPDAGTFSQPDGEYGFFVPTPGVGPGFRGNPGLANAGDTYNFAPVNYLITPQERYSLFTNGSLDITDTLRFKVTATYNQRRSEVNGAETPLTNDASSGPPDSPIGISRDSLFNPFGQDINEFFRRMVEAGPRRFFGDVRTVAFHGMFEGTLEFADRAFDWEAGYFYGENKANNTTAGLFQTSAVLNAVGPSMLVNGVPTCVTVAGDASTAIAGCVPMNLLGGAGAITPQMLAYTTFIGHDELGFKQKTYYANIGGELFEMPGDAGPLAFSFGVEHRTESGFDQPDALINSGDTSGSKRTATSGGYSVDEAYLELSIPLLKDLPFARLLDVSLATRYSDYSTFGDTLNSKFGFRWKPIDDLMIRGNWSEGFRAPSIAELFTGQADSFPAIQDPCAGSLQGVPNPNIPAGCAGIPQYNQSNTQIRITVGGNTNLLPETSTSKTLGFVYNPSWLPGFDISLDWWQIDIKSAIIVQTGQAIIDGCHRAGIAANCALIVRTPGGQVNNLLAVPNNIGTFFNEGYDMTVGYRLPETAWGKFSFVWDTTYFAVSTTDLNGDGVITQDPVDGEGGNNVGKYFGAAFVNNWRIRSNLSARWELGDWGATWFARYYSKQDEVCIGTPNVPAAQRARLCSDPTRITDLDGAGPAPRPRNRIPSVVFNDVAVFWKTPWNAKVTLGVNNVLDKDPPVAITAFANSFDPQYDIPGRFFYMQYNQKF